MSDPQVFVGIDVSKARADAYGRPLPSADSSQADPSGYPGPHSSVEAPLDSHRWGKGQEAAGLLSSSVMVCRGRAPLFGRGRFHFVILRQADELLDAPP